MPFIDLDSGGGGAGTLPAGGTGSAREPPDAA